MNPFPLQLRLVKASKMDFSPHLKQIKAAIKGRRLQDAIALHENLKAMLMHSVAAAGSPEYADGVDRVLHDLGKMPKDLTDSLQIQFPHDRDLKLTDRSKKLLLWGLSSIPLNTHQQHLFNWLLQSHPNRFYPGGPANPYGHGARPLIMLAHRLGLHLDDANPEEVKGRIAGETVALQKDHDEGQKLLLNALTRGAFGTKHSPAMMDRAQRSFTNDHASTKPWTPSSDMESTNHQSDVGVLPGPSYWSGEEAGPHKVVNESPAYEDSMHKPQGMQIYPERKFSENDAIFPGQTIPSPPMSRTGNEPWLRNSMNPFPLQLRLMKDTSHEI